MLKVLAAGDCKGTRTYGRQRCNDDDVRRMHLIIFSNIFVLWAMLEVFSPVEFPLKSAPVADIDLGTIISYEIAMFNHFSIPDVP